MNKKIIVFSCYLLIYESFLHSSENQLQKLQSQTNTSSTSSSLATSSSTNLTIVLGLAVAGIATGFGCYYWNHYRNQKSTSGSDDNDEKRSTAQITQPQNKEQEQYKQTNLTTQQTSQPNNQLTLEETNQIANLLKPNITSENKQTIYHILENKTFNNQHLIKNNSLLHHAILAFLQSAKNSQLNNEIIIQLLINKKAQLTNLDEWNNLYRLSMDTYCKEQVLREILNNNSYNLWPHKK